MQAAASLAADHPRMADRTPTHPRVGTRSVAHETHRVGTVPAATRLHAHGAQAAGNPDALKSGLARGGFSRVAPCGRRASRTRYSVPRAAVPATTAQTAINAPTSPEGPPIGYDQGADTPDAGSSQNTPPAAGLVGAALSLFRRRFSATLRIANGIGKRPWLML